MLTTGTVTLSLLDAAVTVAVSNCGCTFALLADFFVFLRSSYECFSGWGASLRSIVSFVRSFVPLQLVWQKRESNRRGFSASAKLAFVRAVKVRV